MLCSLSTLRYFKGVSHLFSVAIKTHFDGGADFKDAKENRERMEDKSRSTEAHHFGSFSGGPG